MRWVRFQPELDSLSLEVSLFVRRKKYTSDYLTMLFLFEGYIRTYERWLY